MIEDNLKYPSFSSFRSLLSDWDSYLENEEIENQINDYLNIKVFMIFFKKGDDVLGASEDGRLTFAKMKSRDDDLPSGWINDASFTAENLTKALEGSDSVNIVGNKDINDVKIIDKDEVQETLTKQAKKLGPKGFKLKTRRIFIMPTGNED